MSAVAAPTVSASSKPPPSSSDGWRRWVRARETLHAYSASNCMLIGIQCHQRGIPGVEAAPLHPPRQPLAGDSHGHLLAPLVMFAESLGYAVAFQSIPGAIGGWCDGRAQRIVVDADVPSNAQVRTLVHEITDALGVDYAKYSRAQAEVIVDTTTLIVLSGIGLDVSGETIPYVAGWGESGALEAVSEFARLIDGLARRIEHAIEGHIDGDHARVEHHVHVQLPDGRRNLLRAESGRAGTSPSRG